MPTPSATLSAFIRRDVQDHIMFGFVEGMRRGVKHALPGVTEQRIAEHVTLEVALTAFATAYGLQPHEFNVESQCRRFRKMEGDWREDQRTKQPETA